MSTSSVMVVGITSAMVAVGVTLLIALVMRKRR